jgi:hypothetical protein
MHAYGDTRTDCDLCETKNTLVRLLAKPIINKSNTTSGKDNPVGELTKKYIEENRKVLEDQKKEYSKKEYDKS